jgi:iron complex outermembrane recepter protein
MGQAPAGAFRSFDIPATTADKSLPKFSEQSGREVLFGHATATKVRTNAVKGSYAPTDALAVLIEGTGLVADTDEKTGAFSISRRTDPNVLRSVPKTAGNRLENQAEEDPVLLSIFQVTGEKDEGYRSTHTVAGTRTIESLRDTPNSISIINRELIDDLGVTTMAELSAFSVTGEVEDNNELPRTAYSFRGAQGTQLRNGILWLIPTDMFSIERVELLRGPSAFLYGEGRAGGALNQVTKQALRRNTQQATLVVGSRSSHRLELDINRPLTSNLAVRLGSVYEDSSQSIHHTQRKFKALYVALHYRPFRTTNINANFEIGRNHEVRASNILADGFSNTERIGATGTYSATVGGYTFVPALDTIYRTVGMRRSGGTNVAVVDENILPRKLNFLGPQSYFRQHYDSLQVTVDQKISERFNLQANLLMQTTDRYLWVRTGSSAAAVWVDPNPTLPDGTRNPYLNERYTEFYDRKQTLAEPQANWRLTAVYDLVLPFTTQRLLVMGSYHKSNPNQRFYSEYVDPSSSSFVGTLINADTLAAYQTNRLVMQQNYFYRRLYIIDGDSAALTNRDTVPGRSVILRDIVQDGAAGHLTRRDWNAPSYGFGASGSYWGGRLRSLVGWRQDSFIQDPTYDYYNQVTNGTYTVASPQPQSSRLYQSSHNIGGVANIWKTVGAYVNYAQSVNVSNGNGGDGLLPGTVRGLLLGDGFEYGLRWSFLEGKLETNWTYYITNSFNNNTTPAVPVAVRNELTAIFPELNPNGVDTQTMKAKGVELETVANLSKNWRLTWNFTTNEIATSERFPQLRSVGDRARERNAVTPETDSFLVTVPEGTPLPGYTKVRSNLVTNYTFSEGALAGFSVGGALQYRDKGYRGTFDLDRDGIAENIWTPGYTLGNLIFGYRTKIANRRVDFRLNINNVLDKTYYRASGLMSGLWGEGRSFRLAARIDF